MRNHLEAHRLRQYQGDIPAAWLESQRLVNCGHCNRLVAGQEGTMHPTCRAEARPSGTRGQAVGHPTESSHSSAIDVTRILLANRPTLRYVPKGCRSLWTTVLTRALSGIIAEVPGKPPGTRPGVGGVDMLGEGRPDSCTAQW